MIDFWSIMLIFISINLDTMLVMALVLKTSNYLSAIWGFGLSTLVLWALGVFLGKGIDYLFPNWITGLMGIVLILMALFSKNDEANNTIGKQSQNFQKLFWLCLSMGGDNLAFYIPWAADLRWSAIIEVGIVFVLMAIIVILLEKWLIHKCQPLNRLLEKCSPWISRVVYLIAGIYVIYTNHLFKHLWELIM